MLIKSIILSSAFKIIPKNSSASKEGEPFPPFDHAHHKQYKRSSLQLYRLSLEYSTFRLHQWIPSGLSDHYIIYYWNCVLREFLYMHPNRGIVHSYRGLDGLVTRPYYPNTLTPLSVCTKNTPRESLWIPVTWNHVLTRNDSKLHLLLH